MLANFLAVCAVAVVAVSVSVALALPLEPAIGVTVIGVLFAVVWTFDLFASD